MRDYYSVYNRSRNSMFYVKSRGKMLWQKSVTLLPIYDDFIESIIVRMNNLKNERHQLINQCCDLWNSIEKYETLLIQNGFEWGKLERFYCRELNGKVFEPTFNYEVININDPLRQPILIQNIKTFVLLWGKIIAEINNEYHKYELFSKIDYWLYRKILLTMNKYQLDLILRGEMLSIGGNLGRHVIRYWYYENGKRKILSKGKTYARIRELKAAGISLRSNKNPNGAEWRMFYESDGYYIYQWCKSNKLNVSKIYTFMPSGYQRGSDGTDSLSAEEILESNDISAYRKMLALSKKPEYASKYQWNGKLLNRQASKEYGIMEMGRVHRFTKHKNDYERLNLN